MKFSQSVMIIFLLGALGIGICGCGAKEPEPVVPLDVSEGEITYRMETVSVGDVVRTKRINCSYVQTKEQEVAFSIGGKIVDKVYVREGDTVQTGDLLVELKTDNLEEQILNLEYQIQKSELQLGYLDAKEKFDKENVYFQFVYQSDTEEDDLKEYDKSIEKIEQNYTYQREDYEDSLYYDREKLKKMKNELASNRIYATMAGTVIKIKPNLEGSTAKRGDVIMTVVDNSNGLFETEEEDMSYISADAILPMSVVYGNAKGEYELMPYQKEAWGEKQLFSIITAPEGGGLEVGTSGTITAVIESRENVLRIPISALCEADGRYYTYILDEDNMRKVQFLEVGLIGNEYVEVISGIKENEKVIKK